MEHLHQSHEIIRVMVGERARQEGMDIALMGPAWHNSRIPNERTDQLYQFGLLNLQATWAIPLFLPAHL